MLGELNNLIFVNTQKNTWDIISILSVCFFFFVFKVSIPLKSQVAQW